MSEQPRPEDNRMVRMITSPAFTWWIRNVAARLEALAAPDQVLVAEGTKALASDRFELRRLGARQLVGREKETEVYELETD